MTNIGVFGLLLVFGLCVLEANATYKRVCYYTNWAQYRPGRGKFMPEDIDGSLCTHVIYAFATMSGNRLKAYEWNDELADSKGMYARVNALKSKHPNLKTLLAVGGWNFGTARMTAMLSSTNNINEFVSTSITFLRERNFDGLDLDFEYPANRGSPPEDKARFAKLCIALRAGFKAEAVETGKPRLLLSAAVPAGQTTIDTGYDIPSISKSLDFINLMSYDFHGAWEPRTGHNSPLHDPRSNLNMDWAAKYWVKKGCPANKLIIGMATYGRGFKLSDPSKNGLSASASGASPAGKYTREAGMYAYYEICDMLNMGATQVWSEHQAVPYLHTGNTWAGYDDKRSLRMKIDMIKREGYGGWMVWNLDFDDFNGQSCKAGRYPLLNAMNRALLLGDSHTTTTRTTATVGTTTSPPATTTSNRPTAGSGHTTTTTKPPAEGSPSTSYNAGDFCAEKPDAFYANPTDCAAFIRCVGHKTYNFPCPPGLYWDPAPTSCNWPDQVAASVKEKCSNGAQVVDVGEVHSVRRKRSLSNLPDDLHVQFDVAGSPVKLHLVRKRNIDINAPVTFARERSKRDVIPMIQDSAVYQDLANMAAISITAKIDKHGRRKRTLEGSFVLNGKTYSIKPAPENAALASSRSKRNIQGNFHEVYALANDKKIMDAYRKLEARYRRSALKNSEEFHRKKRATSGTIAAYHVELLFVFDHTVWKFYLNQANNDRAKALSDLKYRYAHQINGMDLAFKTIDAASSGFTISPFLVGYHIAESAADSPWTVSAIKRDVPSDFTETYIDARMVIKNLGEWSVQNGRSWTNPDHVMLWTLYDIRTYTDQGALENDYVGYAEIGGICQPGRSTSLLEDLGIHSWAMASHELGHNLGAKHDDSSVNSCTEDSQYIMAAYHRVADKTQILNKFMFSSCSVQYMKDTLEGNTVKGWPRVCLTNRVCSHDKEVDVDRLPGTVYSLDEQCKINYGRDYVFYQSSDDICYKLRCSLPGASNYYYRTPGAAHGTPCGNNQCCYRGACVDDCSNPPASSGASCVGTGLPTEVPPDCVDASELRYTYDGVPIECADVPRSFPRLCFDSWVQPRCCATCHAAGIITPTQHLIVEGTAIDTTTTTTTAATTTTTTAAATTTTTAAAAGGATDAAAPATDFCEGKADGYYQNTANCNAYIQCVWSTLFNLYCPSGLYWDPVGHYCNWPSAIPDSVKILCE